LLGGVPRILSSADGLDEMLRGAAELVADAVRADAVVIRLGGFGGAEVVHVRRAWGDRPLAALPTRLAVPLVIRGRRLGLLTVVRAGRRAFPPPAGATVGSFAGPIAMALDNARLFGALQDRMAEVTRLEAASEAIAALGDLDTVGAQVARHAATLVGAERAAVLLIDEAGESLRALPTAFGFLPAHWWRLRYRLADDGPHIQVFRSGRPYIVNDAVGDQRDPCRSARALEEHSLLIVPLRVGHPLGVLRVSNKRQGLFTRQDARLLGVFAAQAAVALDNAQLYQSAVREREQLKELERLKSHFLSLVSHELRTPLSSIKTSAEVLLTTASPDAPEAHVRLLRNIDRSSDRLSALITDLLDLARLEGGKLELHPEPTDLRSVTEDAIATVRPLADGRRQTVAFVSPGGPCLVNGDRRRLEQIALNLLTNAVKYSPIGGTIRVEVGMGLKGDIRLSVADEGAGIATEQQERVFERFYRLDNEATLRAPGTGLGLPIAKALTELHGGTIEVRSTPGRGSTFTVSLPGVASQPDHLEESREA